MARIGPGAFKEIKIWSPFETLGKVRSYVVHPEFSKSKGIILQGCSGSNWKARLLFFEMTLVFFFFLFFIGLNFSDLFGVCGIITSFLR